MPAKPAKPERFVVDKIGTPDPPNTEYFVLDLVNDFDCRVALAFLGRSYERRNMDVRAKECFDTLKATEPAFNAVIDKRNELHKAQQKKNRSPKERQSQGT